MELCIPSLHSAVGRRVCRILVVEIRGRPRGKDSIRALAGHVSEGARNYVRARNLLEEKACWRSVRKAHLHVGGRRNRDSLSTANGVPWRIHDDDRKVDGESLKGHVVVMDRETAKKTLEREGIRSSAAKVADGAVLSFVTANEGTFN